MPATVRLMRIGKKKNPFYRIIVTDKRKKRDGKYIEKLGFYNPLTNPPTISIDFEKFRGAKNVPEDIIDDVMEDLFGDVNCRDYLSYKYIY